MNEVIKDVIRKVQEIKDTMEMVIENNEDALNRLDAPILANLSENAIQLINELTAFNDLIR